MSTRAQIALYNPKLKQYQSVYCHFDGYPQGVGQELLVNWNSAVDAAKLTSKGSMSYPGQPHPDKVAIRPKVVVGDQAFREVMESDWADWAYRWNTAKAQWEVSKDGTIWAPLAELVRD